MAKEQQELSTSASSISITQEQLLELLKAANAPHVDEKAVARKEKARQDMRDGQAAMEAGKRAAESNCSHLRDDNTSRIAWAANYHPKRNVYITEGFCQYCNKHFKPGVDQYEQYIRIPTGKPGVIGY